MKYKLTVAYDGTHYCGWQVQPNATSIQTLVQNALETALRAPTHLTGSGRTDSGVHARAQVAHFTTAEPIDPPTLLRSLNGLLPPDIRIRSIDLAPDDFHARYSARGKIYRYYVQHPNSPDPFRRLYRSPLNTPVDLTLIARGAAHFIGEHDFTTFSNEAHKGSAANDPVRTLRRLELHEDDGGFYLEFEGNGFLYKMVRNITGTLLDIGREKLSPSDVPRLLEARDRKKASPCAPAQGLFLIQVLYD